MREFSLLGFVAELAMIDRDLKELGPHIVERACKMVQAKAKSAIGREHEEWPPLAPSTITDKERKGYKVPAPLLRTGELRNSIEYVVRGNEGAVGSNLEIAVWQELGTSHIPPRSFLVSSAIASEDRIHRMAGAATVSALLGHGRNVGHIRELIHNLHQIGHALYDAGEDFLEDDSE